MTKMMRYFVIKLIAFSAIKTGSRCQTNTAGIEPSRVAVKNTTKVIFEGGIIPGRGYNMMLLNLFEQLFHSRIFSIPIPHVLPPCKRHDVFFQFRG